MTERPSKLLYTAEVTATGGRSGHARSSDGLLELDLALPTGMGGPGGATNPEQLFAAGYAACFQTTLALIAGRRELDLSQSTVTSKVGIGPVLSGALGLAVELEVDLPGLEPGVAKELVDTAHQLCPYSNATRGNIDVSISVI